MTQGVNNQLCPKSPGYPKSNGAVQKVRFSIELPLAVKVG